MRKPGIFVFSFFMLLVILGLIGVISYFNIWSKGSQANPAQPWEMAVFYAFLAMLGVWIVCGIIGYIIMLRRGVFATLMEKLVGAEYLFCFLGILLVGGLWIPALLPGPFLIWLASTRSGQIVCPRCKNWMPRSAARCAHCGEPLPGPADQTGGERTLNEANLATQPAGSSQTPSSEPPLATSSRQAVCEKCGQYDTPGALYSFAYGTFAGSQAVGRKTIQYNFKISGQAQVFLCDDCVTRYGNRFLSRRFLGIIVGMVVIIAFLAALYLAMKAADPTLKTQVDFKPALLLLVILLPIMYMILNRRRKKNPLEFGDQLAIQLRRPALCAQGYTRFFTRQQLRDNQLL